MSAGQSDDSQNRDATSRRDSAVESLLARRKALQTIAKYGAYTAPALMALLASEKALASSII
jgi:hypothetical protein